MSRFLAFVFAILLLGLGMPDGHAAGKPEPWTTWSRNPLTIPVTVHVSNVYAESNSTVRVVLADGSLSLKGLSCTDIPTNGTFVANLKVRREYRLLVEGTNFTSADITLTYQPNWTPLGRRGRAAQPKVYRLLVDRNFSPDGVVYPPPWNPFPCTAYTNLWMIELNERLPGNWRLEDGSDDPTPAPGDGTWAEIGPGKSMDKSRAALSWSVALGRLMDGTAAGRLTIREANLSREIYTPTNIYYTAGSEVARDQVELILQSPGSPVLRQVKANQTFVNIVAVNPTNETEMRFYLPTQVGAQTNSLGHYTNFTGSPFVTWSLVNPQPSTTNQLQIVEKRNNLNRTNAIAFDAASSTDTWVLKYGTGAEQRIEKRGVQISSSNRVETVDIHYANAPSAAYRAEETYHQFPWGLELVKTKTDATNDVLVTSITFNTNTNAGHSYRKPDTITYPDGFWEKRIYDDLEWMYYGSLLYVLRPDRGGPTNAALATPLNSIVSRYDYDGMTPNPEIIRTHFKDTENEFFREDQMYRRSNFSPSLGGIDYSFDGSFIAEAGTWPVGVTIYTPDESWGIGSFGHEFYRNNDQGAEEIGYVNGGTYNPGTKVFTVGGGEIWESPDFRKCTIYTGVWDGLPDTQDNGVDVSMADGEVLIGPDGWSPVTLYPYRSWREALIYQKGSLVQKELHILTGLNAGAPVFDEVGKWVYANDALGHATNITWIDKASGVSRVVYSANYKGTDTYDGDLLQWEWDETGQKTIYTYDSQKRLSGIRKEGIGSQPDILITRGYDAYGRVTSEVTSAGSLSIGTSTAYDLAGRITNQTDTNGLTTRFAYQWGGRLTTKTLPSGYTEVTENYLDRRVKSVTGTGVVPTYHDWRYITATEQASRPLMGHVVYEHVITNGSPSSTRIRREAIDWVGRTMRFESPDWGGGTNVEYHGYFGYPTKLLSSISRTTRPPQSQFENIPVDVFYYGIDGNTNLLVTLIDGIGDWEDPANNHRMTRAVKMFSKLGGHWFECTTNFVFRTVGSATPTLRSAVHQRLNGFASGNILSEVVSYDADTNATIATVTVDRAAKSVTEVINPPLSTLDSISVTVNGLPQSVSTPSISQPARYGYDALGRQTSVTNTAGAVSSLSYVSGKSQVASQSDFTGLQTTFAYYTNNQAGAGQLRTQTVGGKTTRYAYNERGQLKQIWGDVPYPEERVYDSFGDLTELRTYRSGSGWSGDSWPGGTFDKTTWVYDQASGLLASKKDHNNATVSFTHWQGLPKTRVWARGGTVMTNLYNDLGELVGIDYSDAGTADVAYVNDATSTFSRTGMPLLVKDGSGIWALRYDHADRLVSAGCTNGAFNQVAVSNRFDKVFGRDLVRVTGPPAPLETRYGFDTYGRLGSVTNGLSGTVNTYLPNTDLLQSVVSRYNGTTVLTTARIWDFGTRLREIANSSSTTVISRHAYAYDPLNRRTRATLEDGSAWAWDYNDRNEVTYGRRIWADQTPAAGQHFAYRYDNLGNRTNTLSGGDASGAGLRSAAYSVNNLNQYSSRSNPPAVDVSGLAKATASLNINGSDSGIHQKVEYFWKQQAITNASAPAWTPIQVKAVEAGNTNTIPAAGSEYVLSPQLSESFSYDLDGNLTQDSLWTYTWDGENRLKQVESRTTLSPATARKRVVFTYDHQSRRASKQSYTHNGSAYVLKESLLFVYDGWNLLAELNATNRHTIRSFAWGNDLSGTMDQAGGIGGLAIVFEHPTTNSMIAHFPIWDGNGNVMGLIKQDQTVSARYEYGTFGEPIRQSGAFARTNPFRWSTKYWDAETDLVYYGYRYYSPSLGRWINRDPIGEEGGLNLFATLQNNPIGLIDVDGRAIFDVMRKIQSKGKSLYAVFRLIAALSGEKPPPDIFKRLDEEKRKIEQVTKGKRRPGQSQGGGPDDPPGGIKGRALSVIAALGFVAVDTFLTAVDAAIAHATGQTSVSPEAQSMFANLERGDQAIADLDAVEAALKISGGAGSAATIAVGVLFDAGDEYVAGQP